MFTIYKDEEVYGIDIRKLDTFHHVTKKFPLVLVTKECLMRSLDLRAKNLGITLIIAASFTNSKNLQQGLGRVGRYGDDCIRLLYSGVPLIDEARRASYIGKLMQFYNKFQARENPDSLSVTSK